MRSKGETRSYEVYEVIMVVASGYIEANQESEAGLVANILIARGIEVTETDGEKVVFLIERESSREVKGLLESLRDIEGVRNVYLAYFSLEEDKE